MKKVIVAATLLFIIELLVMIGVIYSGVYDISTSNRETGIIRWVLNTSVVRSVKHHARGVETPTNLADPGIVQDGFKHYQEMCVQCHGAPGTDAGEIANGLWPTAPALSKSVPDWSPSEL